jgi:hypothetical protein
VIRRDAANPIGMLRAEGETNKRTRYRPNPIDVLGEEKMEKKLEEVRRKDPADPRRVS